MPRQMPSKGRPSAMNAPEGGGKLARAQRPHAVAEGAHAGQHHPLGAPADSSGREEIATSAPSGRRALATLRRLPSP